jgi:hypothetical protein
VLVPSSRMLARMRLTGQLGRRGDEASWHQSSRRVAVAVGEMAFTREEENGMGGGSGRRTTKWRRRRGVRLGIQQRQPIDNDPGTRPREWLL